MAEELCDAGIAANSLWPRTTIAIACLADLPGGDGGVSRSRNVDIMADAAHAVLTRDSRDCTGGFYIEVVPAEEGVTDLERYRTQAGESVLEANMFTDPRDLTLNRGHAESSTFWRKRDDLDHGPQALHR